jgi:hypothetical protein
LRRVLYRGEAVSALKRAIYSGRISPTQAKRVDEMQAVADALSLLVHIVMAWKSSQTQAALGRWSNRPVIAAQLICSIAPTKLESGNLRGVFRFPVNRCADPTLPLRSGPPITGTDGRNRSRFDATNPGFESEQESEKINHLPTPSPRQ